jgi:hypothetical protein
MNFMPKKQVVCQINKKWSIFFCNINDGKLKKCKEEKFSKQMAKKIVFNLSVKVIKKKA